MTLHGKHVLIILGGTWHDFAGFTAAIVPLLESAGCTTKVTYDLDVLTRLDEEACQLVLSYTCLTEHRPDHEDTGPERLTDEQLAGLARWVQNGGSLLGVHAATVIGKSNPSLGDLLGGIFLSHPQPFTFRVYPLAGKHPITAGIEAFDVHDEFYLQRYDPSVNIHMVALYEDTAHPMVWSKAESNGRVAYIAMGHFPEIWNRASYQRLMLQAVHWLVDFDHGR